MRKIYLETPLTDEQLKNIRVKDLVYFSGEVLTMRDQAHKRLFQMYKARKKLPVDLKNKVIYYCGPTPPSGKRVIGSCGPTTSERMDEYTYFMIDRGVKAFIGKGERRKDLVEYFRKHHAVYFLAVGGAGSYYAQRVLSQGPVCFKDLGPEAIYRLTVKDFPLVSAIDSQGRYVYAKKVD